MGSSTCICNHLETWNKKAQYQMDSEFCDCFLKLQLKKPWKEREREREKFHWIWTWKIFVKYWNNLSKSENYERFLLVWDQGLQLPTLLGFCSCSACWIRWESQPQGQRFRHWRSLKRKNNNNNNNHQMAQQQPKIAPPGGWREQDVNPNTWADNMIRTWKVNVWH